MKFVEKKDVVENERMSFEKITETRLEDNIRLFNNEEINIIKNNKSLVEKIYLLGMLDCKKYE